MIVALFMHVYVLSDWIRILRSAQARDVLPGAVSQKSKDGGGCVFSSKITASNNVIVHIVCVIIMYTI